MCCDSLMKTVSLLCYLGRTVFVMAWFGASRLYCVFDWIWRKLLNVWRCTTGLLRPIVGYAFLAIGYRRGPGRRRAESEVRDEETRPQPTCSVRAEESVSAGQSEVVIEVRAAGFPQGSDKSECEEDDAEEFYCSYDSTWDTEEEEDFEKPVQSSRRAASNKSYKFRRFENAARDMQNYRHDYPTQMRPNRWTVPDSDDQPNLKFYCGLKPSKPDGVYISEFHNWLGEYESLEYMHSYIQWLFPLQEPGMNNEASPLTKEEIKGFLNSSTAKENLLESYKLMLDFYGIQLVDENTGEVKRASNWRDRFHNLNTHTHNNLRITRILKCQGTLGYPHYQAPLVHFFLEETLINGELPNVKESALSYFLFAVKDKKQRRSLIKFAYLNYDGTDEFVWCPKKIQKMWSGQKTQKVH